jgi:uncharacterized protein
VVNPSTSTPSPLSPKPSTPDSFVWWRSLVLTALLLVALAVGIVFALVVVRSAHVPLGDPRHPSLTWGVVIGQILLYVPVIGTLVALLPWVAQRPLAELGLRPPGPREITFGVTGGVVMLIVALFVAGIQYALLHLKTEQLPVQLLARAHDPSLIAGFALLAIVVAPFAEEFVFRGFVFNALRRYLPVPFAMVLSAALFGLAHADMSAFAPLWAGGIVLAWVYWRSGSLTCSMISHATFNTVQVVLIVFAHQT